MLNIGWFSTGRDQAALDLLKVTQAHLTSGEIDGKIIFTFSNREPGESTESDLFFNLVRNYHIPLIWLSSKNFFNKNKINDVGKRRIQFDRAVMEKLQIFSPDICVLAGYMLIVGEQMCTKYDMINLHPAMPDGPTGSWQEVIWSLIENKADMSGVMMHLVTPQLDRGPVISYCSYSIRGVTFNRYWKQIEHKSIDEIKNSEGENNKLFKLIRNHGLTREFPLIILTLKSLCSGDVKVINKKIYDSYSKAIYGYNLTSTVDSMIGVL